MFREMSLNLFFFAVVFFQLNSDLVSTVSNIMEADSALLVEAQRRSKACSRFVPYNFNEQEKSCYHNVKTSQ